MSLSDSICITLPNKCMASANRTSYTMYYYSAVPFKVKYDNTGNVNKGYFSPRLTSTIIYVTHKTSTMDMSNVYINVYSLRHPHSLTSASGVASTRNLLFI